MESLGNLDDTTTYQRNVSDGESNDADVVIRQPVTITHSGDIELTEGDLGLGDSTFNPRS